LTRHWPWSPLSQGGRLPSRTRWKRDCGSARTWSKSRKSCSYCVVIFPEGLG